MSLADKQPGGGVREINGRLGKRRKELRVTRDE